MYRRVQVFALTAAITFAGAAAAIAASSPSVITGPAHHIHQTSATLTGTVNPNGSSSSYVFEWGLTTGYGATSAPKSAGSGSKAVLVSTTASGLIPGTVYHYAIVATNRYGTSVGADRTFKTAGPPPASVATGTATNVTTTGVTLTGIINPNGAVTGYRFEYGLSSAYTTYTIGGSVPAGASPVVVTEALAGLSPGTIFHYRLVAFHGSTAVSYGADQEFMTHPVKRAKPGVTTTTQPRHAHRKPFIFTTSGAVTGPKSIPALFDCSGFVSVRFYLGKRSVALTVVPVQPNCSYSAQTTFTRLPGRGARHRKVTLNVVVTFRGNGYLLPRRARQRMVVLG